MTSIILSFSKDFDPNQPRDWRGRWVHIGGKLFKVIDAPGDGDNNFHYERASGADKRESSSPIHDEAGSDGSKKLIRGGSPKVSKPPTKKPSSSPKKSPNLAVPRKLESKKQTAATSHAQHMDVKQWTLKTKNSKIIKAAGNEVLKGKTPERSSEKNAAAMLQYIAAAKPTPKTLHRGMIIPGSSTNSVQDDFKPGSSIDMGLSSFTSSPSVARTFTSGTKNGSPVRGTKVIMTVKPGLKAIDVEAMAPSGMSGADNEHEFISAGKFKVVSSKVNGGTVTVTIEQVGTYDVG